MDDNKALRTTHSSTQYVITTKREGVTKYVSRDYLKKHSFHYTVKLNQAKRFQDRKQAWKVAEWLGIDENCDVVAVKIEMRLEVSE